MVDTPKIEPVDWLWPKPKHSPLPRRAEAWTCPHCQQVNSWWAKDCGRCEKPHVDGEGLVDHE